MGCQIDFRHFEAVSRFTYWIESKTRNTSFIKMETTVLFKWLSSWKIFSDTLTLILLA